MNSKYTEIIEYIEKTQDLKHLLRDLNLEPTIIYQESEDWYRMINVALHFMNFEKRVKNGNVTPSQS